MRPIIAECQQQQASVLGLLQDLLLFAASYAATPGAATAPSGNDPQSPAGFSPGAIPIRPGSITCLTTGLYYMDICFDRVHFSQAGLESGDQANTSWAVAMIVLAVLLAPGGNQPDATAPAVFAAWKLGTWKLGPWHFTAPLFRLARRLGEQTTAVRRRIVLLGDSHQIVALARRLQTRRGERFDPVALDTAGLAWPLLRRHRIWGVVIACDPAAPSLAPLVSPLLDCKLRGARVFSGAAFQESYLGRIDLDSLAPGDLLLADGFAASRIGDAAKRCCDIIGGVALVLLSLPLMVLAAIAIKADSRGPILYRQERAGQFGRPFTLFKFRSMTTGAERGGTPRWAQRQDPRITRVGRFIRATRMDELPQLANVIRGDMSLVGPRPERPHFVRLLAQAIPLYVHRSYVKPGVTGWAQINFPYGASVEDAREKLAYDLYYVKHRSFLLDMAILLSTIRVVLLCEGSR